MNVCAKWAIFGKQNWRCGLNRTSRYGAQLHADRDEKAFVHNDSRAVVMKVDIR